MNLKLTKDWLIAIFLTLLYLILNLATINDYGVTWDFTYHLNAGLQHLKQPLTTSDFIMFSWGPLGDILPTLSYLIFSKKLSLLPFDSAYNLYSTFIGSVGVGIIFLLANKLFNLKIALFSSLILALLPRYFGHLHNNMKDIPQAVLFSLAIMMFLRLFNSAKFINLLLALFIFAIAFNVKYNAIFVLIITLVWSMLMILPRLPKLSKEKLVSNLFKFNYTYLYFIFAPLAAYALWSVFWPNPWERLLDAKHSATTTTTNMPVLYFGKIYQSGVNIPWHYPLGMLSATTPFPIMIFFIFGLFYLAKNIRNSKLQLVTLWFFIPLMRFFLPGMIVIDDIRHFMEIIFPFSLIAALGLAEFITLIKKISHPNIFVRFFPLLFFGYLGLQLILIHPYQTSYFSEFLGGIRGAYGKFDIEFWAHSYKEALQWLNKNASVNSKITIAMAPNIAKLYLRADLITQLNQQNMAGANSSIYSQSDYTVILNRQSFFDWYGIFQYLKENKPIYTLNKQGVPLVYIFKN